uniref:GIN domain-containing protein n=1 Tax=Ornithobacterium rhinotracheale TaxID=28251 RepID=UPI0039A66A72
MKKILLLSALGLSLISCQKDITGEGSADMAQDYKVQNFDKIEAKGMFKITLIENDSAYISVQTHENLIENLDISTSGNTLKINEKKEVNGFESYNVYVYYNQPIEEIDLAGKVLAESAGIIQGNKLDISTQDEAKVNQFSVNLKELEAEAKDKSEMAISGVVTKLSLEGKGLSSIQFDRLSATVASVNLNDEAKAALAVQNELSGKISDNTSLEYSGNPKKDVDVKDRAKIQNN